MDKNGFLIDLSEGDSTEFGRVAFAEQSSPQRVFSAIWSLESEVNNGGFEQYFVSAGGETANFVPDALRQIGAHACATVVERALTLVSPGGLPDSQDDRVKLLDAMSEDTRGQLEALDSEFFAYPDDLTELLFAFVQRHPESFGAVPADGNV